MSRILFKKEGTAKYISHLDLLRTMQRTFIRSGVEIKHSEGYNPHPYMSFAMPLSVGTESECELMDFVLTGGAEIGEIPALITKNSPAGITVLDAYEETRKLKEIRWLRIGICLLYDNGVPDGAEDKLARLYARDSLVVRKISKDKVRDEDIIPLIDSVTFSKRSDTEVYCEAVIAAQNPSLSPALMMSAIGVYAPELTPDFTTFRRLEIYDEDKKIFR